MNRQFTYDAFISYRHLPLDEAIAEKVQKLLEQYRPPRSGKIKRGARIGRIFRDKTELPTSGDLSQSLVDALLSSRYLIVVLSEETKNSKWCMEEIRAFKEAHDGSINNILPVLVSGDPRDVIPDELRFEMRKEPSGKCVRVEVEPLCCDVRAESARASYARLRTEFLRLAAPMLGCGYDDLYRRHHRRSNQLKMAVMTVLTVILGVITVFAYTSYVAEQRYEGNLVDTYTRQGAEQLLQGNSQEALMYYASALRLDPADQAAKTGALLLLQQNNWLHLTGQEEGQLIDGRAYRGKERGVAAMNGDGSQTFMQGFSNAYLGDREGTIQTEFAEYGRFIASAKDGSCWTFADEESVYFYFTEDGSVWQVERPVKINPCCDMEMAEYYADELPAAMAVSRERAVVRWGGYLYLYNLLEDGRTELFCEFDLANVFPGAGNSGLDVWNSTWIDDGGELAVLYNVFHAAVFDVNNVKDPCLNNVHTKYEFGLNDVAFSSDGEVYALVYGNDYGIDTMDPGGFFEVYDANGTLCMATEFDPAVALSGAAIEPGGTRILVWGSSILQVWDYETGRPAASSLRLDRISSAAWNDDGSILVDDGKGTLSTYMPVTFEPYSAAPVETVDSDQANNLVYEAALSGGLTLRRSAVEIWLENENGEKVGTASFGEDFDDDLFINRMYLDAAEAVGYFWFNGHDFLYRVTVDGERQEFAASEVLDTHGWPVVGVQACAKGAVAMTGNGYLLYYEPESTVPALTLQLGRSGIVKETASDDSGLLAVILRSTDFVNPDVSHRFDYRYSMELWDLNMGVRLGDLEDGQEKLEQLSFTADGWLTYRKDGETVALLIDARNPDPAAAQYLADISCFRLNEDQFVETKPVSFTLSEAGIWNNCLSASHTAAVQEAEPLTLTQELDQILLQQGTDAWLKRCTEIWTALSQSDVTAHQMVNLFKACYETALQNGCKDQIRPAFESVIGKLKECSPDDSVHMTYNLLFNQYALTSKAYDDLLVEYLLFLAEKLEALCDPELAPWELNYLSVYEHRLYANLLQGAGMSSFYLAIDEAYQDQLADMLLEYSFDILFYLVNGEPEKAAVSMKQMLAQYDSFGDSAEEAEETKNTLFLTAMVDFTMFEQRGIIAEEDLSAFVDYVYPDSGLRLVKASYRNLQAGLRLGDMISAVEGVRILNDWQLYELQERYPTARLTVIRNGEYLLTEPIEDWNIVARYETK